MAQETSLNDNTPQDGEQTQHKTPEELPRAATTKKRFLAEGWRFFNAYMPSDPKHTKRTYTKNGGKGKTSTKTPASSKNGQPHDNKKTAK